jgi:hypothetical protein
MAVDYKSINKSGVQQLANACDKSVMLYDVYLELDKKLGREKNKRLPKQDFYLEQPIYEPQIPIESDDRAIKFDASLKNQFEYLYDIDFSSVTIHTGNKANEIARASNAEAVTLGSDIYFAQSKYAPETEAGLKLLAHELQHVVQNQRGDRFVYLEDIAQAEHEAEKAEDAMNINLIASGNAFPDTNLTPSPMPPAIPTPYPNSSISSEHNVPLKKPSESTSGALEAFSGQSREEMYSYTTKKGDEYFFTANVWKNIKKSVIALWVEHLEEKRLLLSNDEYQRYHMKFINFIKTHRV